MAVLERVPWVNSLEYFFQRRASQIVKQHLTRNSFSNEKLRIVAMNLFEGGIAPKWEDPQNKDGKILLLEYRIDTGIDRFLQHIEDAWSRLMLSLMGESLVFSQYVKNNY